MYCRKCGKELADNSLFCSGCGTSVNKDDSRMGSEPKHKLHRSRTRKYAIVLAVCVLLVLAVAVIASLCGNKVVSQSEICKEISNFSEFTNLNMSIQEYSEEKRDTDKGNKYDHIWVDVVAENDKIGYKASYYIEYGLYNDGWLLESIEILDDNYYALEMVTVEEISTDLQAANKGLITKYALTNITVDVEIPELNKELKVLRLICDVAAENNEMIVKATIASNYRLDMTAECCGWTLVNSSLTEYSYEAKHGPSEALIKETTQKWSGEYKWVSEYLSKPNNLFIIEYEEHDADGFENCTVDWENTLTYKFDPEKGGWYLSDEEYEVTSAVLDVNGFWAYADGNEYVKLNVISANSEEINYDLDVAIVPTNILYIGNQPVTSSGKNLSKKWSYEYVDEELCLIFSATEPVYTISYIGGSYTDEYNLYYKAYLGEVMGTSGFYFDDRPLSKSN